MIPLDSTHMAHIATRLHPGAALLSGKSLTGGVSALVTAIEVLLPNGERQRLVVRQYGHATLGRDPSIARHEFLVLQLLNAKGLPVPRPIMADDSGTIVPDPYPVIEFVEGAVVDKPADVCSFVTQMATVLAAIHAANLAGAAGFLSTLETAITTRLHAPPRRLDESLSEGRIREVLGRAWPPSRRNQSLLLHGDFWPGNMMWRDDRLVAVIDWEDAALGDPLADLANGRLEIMMHFGIAAMTAFTERYQALAPALDYTSLSLWDLWAALRPAGQMSDWGLEAPTLRQFQARHRAFVDRAIEKLGGRTRRHRCRRTRFLNSRTAPRRHFRVRRHSS